MDIRTLTTRIGKGDESAFDRFYETYAQRMYRYLVVVTRGDEQQARDVHADALLKVVRYMKPMDREKELWQWLARVMRTTWIDHLRRAKRGPAHFPLSDDDEPVSTEDEAQSELLAHLEAALSGLPEDDRRLVEAHYFDGAPQTDLARDAGITPKALGMRLSRLRRRLRAVVMEELRRA